MSDEVHRAQQGDSGDIDRLVDACTKRLRPQSQWTGLAGYPGGLALAVIDSIWSIGARYPITVGVIGRYRSFRRSQGADASQDSLVDLLDVFQHLGGVDQFIDEIGTRNRVSTQRDAPRKGEAVYQAANVLVDLGISTAEQLITADGTDLGRRAREGWLMVPGQGSGLSWRYLRMLVGLPDVKPDRMVIRFVAAALGVDESVLPPDRAAELVNATAERLGVDPRGLDHEIWEHQAGYTGSCDPVSATDKFRVAARSFVGAAFHALADRKVLPTSIYRPFLRVGHDYEGTDLMGLPEFTELEAAFCHLYPERFVLRTTPRGRPGHEFANGHVFRFLEAAIARCAASLMDFEADGEPVSETIEDLLAYLEADTEQLYCCRAVSHLTTVTGEPVSIGAITVVPESGPGDLLDRTRALIPRAFDESPPHFFFDPPHSLIFATATSTRLDATAAGYQVAHEVDRFLQIARLLLAGTHQSCWQVTGPASTVSAVAPRHRTFGKDSMSALMQRVVRLDANHAAAFAAFGDFLDAATVQREGKVATSFDVALYRFNRAHESHDAFEAVVDLATALEAVLTGDGKETDAISLRLRSRASALLATETDSGRSIFDDIGRLYSLRSKLVHGGSISEAELEKIISRLSTAPSGMPPRVSLTFAVDRLRDLVRRAFLARLCLAAEPGALWPFGKNEVPVDAVMADDRDRNRWRQHWRHVLADLGVSDAAEAAAPGVDPLRVDHSAQ